MLKTLTLLLVGCISFSVSHSAYAFSSPLSVGIVPPIQFPTSDFSVTGVRASVLWGRHRDMYGIDVGLLGNVTEQEFVGIALSGGFNYTSGNTTAIGGQISGLGNFNTNKTDVYGVQAAGLLNKNDAASSVNGLQIAVANLAPHTVVRGVQAGIYNRALAVYGFQIGLVNRADNLHGLQIGLINFHHKGTFAVSPFLNFGW